MISPVQFIVQVNSLVLVRCHHLNVCSQDVHLCAELFVPAEIHHQLFGLPGVKLEVVRLALVYKVLNKFSVGSVVHTDLLKTSENTVVHTPGLEMALDIHQKWRRRDGACA